MPARCIETPSGWISRLRVGALFAAAAIWCAFAAAPARAVPNPTVTGPLASGPVGDPSRNYPFFATDLLPGGGSYVEHEYFMAGTATRFSTACPSAVCPDESSEQPVTVVSTGHPYKVRLLVRRPANPASYNGQVIVEFLNTFYGHEFDLQWSRAAEYFVRRGFAYVGVGPQRDGIHTSPHGLRAWNPARYGTLDVTHGGTITDDSLKWDIFSQAAQAIRQPIGVDPLGGLQPRRLIATSDSQASANLVTYLNTVHRLEPLFPGAVLAGPLGILLRADVTTKVLKVPGEWDLIAFESGMRRPDSANQISWEVAGLSHSSHHTYASTTAVSTRDTGVPGVLPGTANCIEPARSRVPANFVMHAAFDAMVRWLDGTRPPSIPSRIHVTTEGDASFDTLARDAHGLAVGGIRLPAVAVPIATNTGWNAGGKAPTPDHLCQHAGTSLPFTETKLRSLYQSHADYVNKVAAAANTNVAQGFLLAEDAAALVAEAQAGGVLVTTGPGSLAVARSGSATGSVTSHDGLIACGTTCAHAYGNGSAVTLTATPAGGAVFTGWQGACTGMGTCAVSIAGATTVSATFAPSTTGNRILDVDANTKIDALTDGLMALRYLAGVTGAALTHGALGAFAARSDHGSIAAYLHDVRPHLDIDGNGHADPHTDGMLIVRHLFGLNGHSLVHNAIGPGARRTSAAAIETYLLGLMP